MREVEDRNILDEFVKDFVKVVDKHCKYIIVSGFVAISHGRSRGTEDIDIIIEKLDKDDFEKLFEDLIKASFECLQSSNPDKVYEYLINKTSVRFVRKGEYLPEMELKFAKDELDNYQFETRTKLPMTSLDIYFSSIEMNIAFKEELLKSDKDLKDAEHLRILYDVDEQEINKIKKMIKKFRLK